ncbi:hypothetical protein MWG62_21445 [Escherichia coli]|uniref:hypothetical protein n=1 Tax=Escherichia coli TaxID=562 RepID=UPI001FF5D642|nr:hypothetical protein [Escherichia coli]MCJ8687429.1 hypothetical protein [Escherichia coli]
MKTLDKIKWSRVKLSITFSELIDYFKRNSYDESKGYGYTFVNFTEHEVSASYVEKSLRTEVIVSPAGDEIEQDFLEYETIKFALKPVSKNLSLLAIFNPPKSIKKLTDRLSVDFNYRVGFGSITLNLKEYINYLSLQHSINLLHIDKIKVSNVVLNGNSKASVEITSTKNALLELESIFTNKKYNIDKVRLHCLIYGEPSFVELSKSAFINSDSNHLDFYSDFLIQQLSNDEFR